jgi:hypothetical protein
MSGVDEMYMENLDEWIFEENKVLMRPVVESNIFVARLSELY